MEPTMEELINKTQLSPKSNFNVITSARWLHNRISLSAPYCCHSAPTNIVRDHHRCQQHPKNYNHSFKKGNNNNNEGVATQCTKNKYDKASNKGLGATNKKNHK